MALYKTKQFYTEDLLRANKDKAFLFGDNTLGRGKGGQAAIRDERNALGIPTKRLPSNDLDAFFYEHEIDRFIGKVVTALNYVSAVAERTHIVVPIDANGSISLGLGLAALDKNSPTTYRLICAYLEALADRYGGWRNADTDF